MNKKDAKLPIGNKNEIIIICTEEQEKYIKECGCIACNDDICDVAFCDKCFYNAEKINFKRNSPYIINNDKNKIIEECIQEIKCCLDNNNLYRVSNIIKFLNQLKEYTISK